MIDAWGAGFWVLIEFTLQMAMIIIGGYAVASSAPVGRLIGWLATMPKNPRSAIAFVAAGSMFASYLNWATWRMVRAVYQGTSAVGGVLLQFPLYGGIFGMIAFTGLSARIAGWLVQATNDFFYPPLIAVYSCVLGVFVPSGGSKWVIEAHYVLDAGHRLGVDPGWLVVVYDLGEASANLLQPFWMLPTLAILGLKARDVMGYTFAMFCVCFPVAIVTVTLLAPRVG